MVGWLAGWPTSGPAGWLAAPSSNVEASTWPFSSLHTYIHTYTYGKLINIEPSLGT